MASWPKKRMPSVKHGLLRKGMLFSLALALGCGKPAERQPLLLVLPQWENGEARAYAAGLAASASLALRSALAGEIRVSGVPEAFQALPLDSLSSQKYALAVAERCGARALLLVRWSREGGERALLDPATGNFSLEWEPIGEDWTDEVAAVGRIVGQRGRAVARSLPPPAELADVGARFLRLVPGAEWASREESSPRDELGGWAEGELLLRRLAQLRLESKDLTEGLLRLGRFLTAEWNDTSSGEWQCLRGAYFVYAERWSEAERWLFRAYRRDPSDGRTLYWLSHLHPSRLKKLGLRSREKALRAALQRNPLLFEARLALAEQLMSERRFPAAREEMERLLALNPDHEGGLMMAGRLFMAMNDIPNSLRTYKHVLDLNPGNADAYYNLGILYFHTGHLDDARALFQRAVEINDHADSHFYLGLIYEKLGLLDKALHEYRVRIGLRKGPADAYADEARERLKALGSIAGDSLRAER
jgi:tetratricopeptide (TPR) repeat protein